MSQPPPASALSCLGLRRTFGGVVAVDTLDLSIARGQFYAFLGPNGAGKTTSLRMFAGLLRPDAGQIFVDGISLAEQPEAAKRRLAYVPDDPVLYGRLRPMEHLEFVAALWSLPGPAASARARALLETLGLWEKRGEYIEALSRGMKQKMALAAALLTEPSVLLLDEPLTGLDAAAARGVKDYLQQFARGGNTVILTTHILEVAERMADRIGILHRGRLAAEGSLGELQERAGRAGATLEELFLQITAAPAVPA